MNRRSKAPARALAFIALAAGLIAIVLVISSSLGDDEDGRGANRVGKQQNRDRNQNRGDGQQQQKAAFYVVQSGDTLTGIAAKTGVSVTEIQELNPGIDPQILVSGQRLKLR